MMKPPAIQYEIRPQKLRHALIGINNFMGAQKLTRLPGKAMFSVINIKKIEDRMFFVIRRTNRLLNFLNVNFL